MIINKINNIISEISKNLVVYHKISRSALTYYK